MDIGATVAQWTKGWVAACLMKEEAEPTIDVVAKKFFNLIDTDHRWRFRLLLFVLSFHLRICPHRVGISSVLDALFDSIVVPKYHRVIWEQDLVVTPIK